MSGGGLAGRSSGYGPTSGRSGWPHSRSCWLCFLGKATLAPRLEDQTMLDALFFNLSWPIRGPSTTGLLVQLFLAVALPAMVPAFFCAFGEELGWRGYLLPRLVEAGLLCPLVFCGLVWGIWH